VEPENNPEVASLVQEHREGLADRMAPRVRNVELGFGLGFLVAAAVVLVVGGTDGFDPLLFAVLLAAYVGAGQVRFEIGRGYTDPTLLVVIPALFVQPPAVVPPMVAAGFILARAPDYLRGRAHPEKALAALGNSWHAVGPALVLSLAVDPGGPRASDTGWYLLAFASYVVGDSAAGILREAIGGGLKPELQIRLLAQVYALDALLAPLGLMAALATARQQYAFLLGGPLLVALAVLSRERGKRFDNALALSESRARVLEAELAAARTRVEILGAVSHGLQTPVAGVVAISGVLARRGATMPGEMVQQSAARLEGDAVALRQVVRQALDYVRLVDGEALALRLGDVDLAPVVEEVTGRLHVPAPATTPGPAVAHADGVRVHQMITALVARGVTAADGDAASVRVALGADDDGVVFDVWEPGPAPDTEEGIAALLAAPTGVLGTLENQGTGVDLFVTAQAAKQLGGSLTGSDDGGSLRWRLRLPAAPPAPAPATAPTPSSPAAATPPTPPPAPPA
jgi:signal transduction histidine kinase